MVLHAYTPSTGETESGGLPVWSQPVLHTETLSQKKKKGNKSLNIFLTKRNAE
jgi:hypothetical protein